MLLYDIVSSIIGVFVILTLIKNYFFLLVSPFYPVREHVRTIRATLKRRAEGKPAKFTPTVSVIVPAWNEEVGIIKTMESIIHNGYDHFEMVVVNDGSTDNSDQVIHEYLNKLEQRAPHTAAKITYIYQKNGGKGVALNTGITAATGDIVLTVDADSALRKGSIKNLTRYFLDEEIMAVVGNVQVTNTSTLIGLAQHLEYFFGFYNKRTHAVLDAEYIYGGACASFRREVFDQIGLFDAVNKTEDIEMSMRTRFHGFRSTYAEDVVCYTEGASTLDGLVKQRIRWKKGRFDTFRKYRSMFFSTEDSHNFYLSFFVLPFSMLAEIQLLFEPIALAILVTYSLVTSEYLSLAIGVAFIFLTYLAVSLFSNNRLRIGIILSFPFTWPLFYFLDWIEFLSLCQSIKMLRTGQEVEWQRWQRTGLGNAKVTAS